MTANGHYSSTMATAVRNVVKLAEAQYQGASMSKGAIDLEGLLGLQMQATKAKMIVSAFYGWYRKTYNPENCTNDLNLLMHFRDQTPFYICGVLIEFAKMVDDIVDTALVLDRAAKVLEVYGWHQGDPGDADIGYCMLGAVDRSLLNSPYSKIRRNELWATTRLALFDFAHTSFLAGWNDTPGRTVDEVKSLLTETAAGIRIVRD